jgi:hypothetical protein
LKSIAWKVGGTTPDRTVEKCFFQSSPKNIGYAGELCFQAYGKAVVMQ